MRGLIFWIQKWHILRLDQALIWLIHPRRPEILRHRVIDLRCVVHLHLWLWISTHLAIQNRQVIGISLYSANLLVVWYGHRDFRRWKVLVTIVWYSQRFRDCILDLWVLLLHASPSNLEVVKLLDALVLAWPSPLSVSPLWELSTCQHITFELSKHLHIVEVFLLLWWQAWRNSAEAMRWLGCLHGSFLGTHSSILMKPVLLLITRRQSSPWIGCSDASLGILPLLTIILMMTPLLIYTLYHFLSFLVY